MKERLAKDGRKLEEWEWDKELPSKKDCKRIHEDTLRLRAATEEAFAKHFPDLIKGFVAWLKGESK